jgi:hypothetical protein
MIPFLQSTQAQGVIDKYLKGDLDPKPNVNSAGVFRNPLFDLRTEQEKAGTLDPSALYPNPQIDFSVPEEEIIDPCQEGYMLVDGICQPIETFGQSMYDENKNDRDDPEERPYMSIEDMQNASDEDLIDYLKSGWLKNSALGYLPSKGGNVTLASGMFGMPLFGQAIFGKQNELRRNAMISELTNRGYFTGNYNDKGNEIFNITSTPNPNLGFNEAEVPYGGAGIINEGVTGSYGGGEDFGGYQGGGSSSNNINSTNNNNIVNYTGNEGQGTAQSGGGVANPHTNTGFSGGDIITGNPFGVNYDDAYGADI